MFCRVDGPIQAMVNALRSFRVLKPRGSFLSSVTSRTHVVLIFLL